MVSLRIRLAVAAAAAFVCAPLPYSADDAAVTNIWGQICGPAAGTRLWSGLSAATAPKLPPVATCQPLPSGYHTLSSVGAGGDTSVSFEIGYDQDAKRLCFVATGLPEAPVLRVGVGHTLSIQIANTLHDTWQPGEGNVECAIDAFGGEGICPVRPIFSELPGPDGAFYPLMANEAHTADGTSNLHVHGLFVPPVVCSDEVLKSAIYPANWRGPTSLQTPCQSAPDTLTYSYQLPANHPAGVYWYHTHRHGQAEHQTQMGLVGAIVVEDQGDAYRASIGVTDEVLLVTDTPVVGCIDPVSCDVVGPAIKRRQGKGLAVRPDAATQQQAALRTAATTSGGTGPVVLDPRIDQVNQAGECADGASDSQGGYELWTLMLNGAAVPEELNGFPPDSQLLTKTMQPGQRQIFRLVNASSNSFVAPQLVLVQNGVQTVEPLEAFARDGVGFADDQGNRHFVSYNVAQSQLIVPPAGRLEFVVHAPPVGAKLYLQSSQVLPGCGGNLYPARRLLLITPSGTPVSPGAADDSDLLLSEPSMAPYLSTLGATATVQRTFVFAEYGRGFTYSVTDWPRTVPPAFDYDPSQTDFYLTQVASTDHEVNPSKTALIPFLGNTLRPQVVVHLHGKQSVTEEWLVENSTLEMHAFHMHQVHFRDITVPSTDPDDQPLLDTITLPAAPLIGDVATGYPGAPGYVRLLMTFTTADIGEFVFHCHILEHEDNGMMAKIQVVAD
jgi:FtsP/CotA-like multicopper oxidase with cupredoxin domain